MLNSDKPSGPHYSVCAASGLVDLIHPCHLCSCALDSLKIDYPHNAIMARRERLGEGVCQIAVSFVPKKLILFLLKVVFHPVVAHVVGLG